MGRVANGVDLGDLGPTRTNEDDFDAHLTAAAILRCVLEGTPVTRSEWIDAEAEGSMLLAGPVDLHKGVVTLLSRVRGSAHATLVPARATVGAGTRVVRPSDAGHTHEHARRSAAWCLPVRFRHVRQCFGAHEVDGMRTSLRPACILSGTRMSRIAGNERASSGSSTPTGS